MIKLEDNKGIPRSMLVMMAIVSGFTVANLYYNQPLLELIRTDIGIGEIAANMITVITQIGYALGLFFIIPMGDLYSRRKILIVNMLIAAVMGVTIGVADNVWLIWIASIFLGACSVTPQLFIPIAGQYSKPENKARNMGFVLSGLLTGILVSRVISGFVGEYLGWREMFFIAAGLTTACLLVTIGMMPDMKHNFRGNYRLLMYSVWRIFLRHPQIRLNSIRAAFGFGSMLSIWSCLAFHVAQPPLNGGSDMVGMLGLAGLAGAIAASNIGKYIPKFGVHRFSIAGASFQIIGWVAAFMFGYSYIGLVVAIILVDIGSQCQQLSNQSGCIQEIPHASNRANTIFMTTYFIGGSLGTLCAGLGWNNAEWTGVCLIGAGFSLFSLLISMISKR